ncbi:MAG: cytochrome-c oxidase, cbb3-type subunit III [Gammaproteobacteria bacterium RIFCSPLOWO2_02_FULL_47_50]|nr:MAG: cytochrome-c oxidase, cbb3-type subunit III [Gammaproteobacteria bacterium RIFCSPLOWO2_01_FULL_47_190]OGT73271.1 MAG: cytochrome-c oxidase, cbb3-type subunit III [Gammaproteobacteria bacterium RIFCSPLOWO2_12_47_11]OGT78912.1 MAG: cytochrome-c oxidase, cbb3-type subunit III [Gammaproteobacteria bacterium RIFCSPLOWO2_02_FULL_47_50]OGT87588.1 MAG: cytochrome-c oxidase, cbb3-type subunit III [Gammaproteobacteria bacterium RIFCSPLOWO2_12_FULL_47_76]
MSDFTSGFWSWFIFLVVLASFALIFWLIRWTAKGKPSKTADGEVETMGHVWDENLEELNNPLPRWWLTMFYITLVFGAVYLVLYPGLGSFKGVLNWSQTNQYDHEINQANETYGPVYNKYLNEDVTALINDADALKIGARLYSTYCTTCHGSDARGVRGFPNLRDNDWLHGGSSENIKKTILNGRQGMMPAWEEILGNDGVFQVTEYVRSLSGREVDSVVAYQGKQMFDKNCVVCHGADGKGNQALGAPNLTDNIWLYGGTQKQIFQSIAAGRNGIMPAHKEFLGEAKVHLLATYIYGLSVDENLHK